MKLTKVLAVAAVLIAALTSQAFAQGGTVFEDGQKLGSDGMQRFTLLTGGMVATDSSGRAFRVSTDGYQYIIPGYTLDRDNILSQYLTGPTTLAIGASDSSATQDLHAYRHPKLLVTILHSSESDTKPIARFAFSFREQYEQMTDTTNTHVTALPTYWPAGLPINTPVVPRGLTQSYSKDTTTALAYQRSDTLTVGGVTNGGSNTAPWPGEFVVERQLTGQITQFDIPLEEIYGPGIWWRYATLRVRNISSGVTTTLSVSTKIIGRSL